MRKAILLISLMLFASSAVAEEAQKLHGLFVPNDLEVGIDRYISWPGQTLGYKIGELKIKELRAKAQRELGPTFDIRAFHDAGPLPLSLLGTAVNAWIAAQGGAR